MRRKRQRGSGTIRDARGRERSRQLIRGGRLADSYATARSLTLQRRRSRAAIGLREIESWRGRCTHNSSGSGSGSRALLCIRVRGQCWGRAAAASAPGDICSGSRAAAAPAAARPAQRAAAQNIAGSASSSSMEQTRPPMATHRRFLKTPQPLGSTPLRVPQALTAPPPLGGSDAGMEALLAKRTEAAGAATGGKRLVFMAFKQLHHMRPLS
jgi:hypothetical protein